MPFDSFDAISRGSNPIHDIESRMEQFMRRVNHTTHENCGQVGMLQSMQKKNRKKSEEEEEEEEEQAVAAS
jgi:hypothetical protein